MFVTASTVKDSIDNVRFFVAANLASGVDHMFVFLDAPNEPEQQAVGELLDAHPHVTCVRTTRREWWAGDRPNNLNTRQRINANWVRTVLEPLAWAEWLFHIDGDEVAVLDRAALDAVPASAAAVHLPPWEAVSEWDPPGRPTRFKRLLAEDDLTLLQVLGELDEPTNQAYFHGHVMGKSGVRPSSGLGLTLHDAVAQDGVPQPRHEDERLKVLHYDAPSGEEFVRKWSALAQAGPVRYRKSRQASARAIRTLVGRDLPDEVRGRYLRRLYEATTQDDVALLTDLGLLGEADPGNGESTARALPALDATALVERVAALSTGPKGGYFVPDPPSNESGGRLSGLRRRLGQD
jgi:hypothetical protein